MHDLRASRRKHSWATTVVSRAASRLRLRLFLQTSLAWSLGTANVCMMCMAVALEIKVSMPKTRSSALRDNFFDIGTPRPHLPSRISDGLFPWGGENLRPHAILPGVPAQSTPITADYRMHGSLSLLAEDDVRRKDRGLPVGSLPIIAFCQRPASSQAQTTAVSTGAAMVIHWSARSNLILGTMNFFGLKVLRICSHEQG